MKKQTTLLKAISILMFVGMASIAFGGTYSGGTGDPNDPYQIATAQDLIALGETTEDYDKHFILTADIDLDPNLPGGRVFDRAVIAWYTEANDDFDGPKFTGTFDGNGFTIHNMTVLSEKSFCGLFGMLDATAKIIYLGLDDVEVYSTNNYVAGLVGLNEGGNIINSFCIGMVSGNRFVSCLVGGNRGTVTSSYSQGVVDGNSQVGGLVGDSYSKGQILNCYSLCTISGQSDVGGLVGRNQASSIRNSYSAGLVSGNSVVGGLVGYQEGRSSTSDSFWDIETSGQSSSTGGTGLSTVEMQDINTYLDAGWDFVLEIENGVEDIWYMPQNDYPILMHSPPTVILAAIESLEATDDDGLIVSIEDANVSYLLTGTTLFENTPEWPIFPPEAADDLDLSTVALCDGQSYVLTQFDKPTNKVVILIRGEGQYGQVHLVDQQGQLMNRIGLFDATVFTETAYMSLGKTIRGMVVTSNSEFHGIHISSPLGETLNLTLVSVVAVLKYPGATKAQLEPLTSIEAQEEDGIITSIDNISTEDLILGTTSFSGPAEWPFFFPEADADNFELDTLANTENQASVQTQFTEPVTKVYLIVRPKSTGTDTGVIELLDDQGQPVWQSIAFSSDGFTNLGHQSLGREAQGLIVTGNGYFHGVRITPDNGDSLGFDLVSVSALTIDTSEHIYSDIVLFSENFEDGNYDGWVEGSDNFNRQVTDQTSAEGSYCLTLIGGYRHHHTGISHELSDIVPDRIEFYV